MYNNDDDDGDEDGIRASNTYHIWYTNIHKFI